MLQMLSVRTVLENENILACPHLFKGRWFLRLEKNQVKVEVRVACVWVGDGQRAHYVIAGPHKYRNIYCWFVHVCLGKNQLLKFS